MQNNNSADRRIFARIPVTLPIRVLVAGQEKEYAAETIDVSANGIGFLSKKRLSPQTSLEMWLELPDSRGPFYTRGEVVWSQSLADASAGYRTGIRLEKTELMGFSPILWR